MSKHFTLFILAGLALGLVVGAGCHALILDPKAAKAVAADLSLITDVFLRLIKMLMAPLVFLTLSSGVAHMGDPAEVGRVGVKTLLWFLGASVVSLVLGMTLADLFQPGSGVHLIAEGGAAIKPAQSTLADFIHHAVPDSAVRALADNEILQVVVFAVFVGCSVAALGPKADLVARTLEQGGKVMLRMVGFVMILAPLAVFASIAATVTVQGLGILKTFAALVGSFYVGLVVLWAILLGAGRLVIGPRAGALYRELRSPVLLAFSTSTSESAFPQTLEVLEEFGVPERIASFVLPLGYSFNLCGSMIYCTFAVLFIAQAYDIHLSLAQQAAMLMILLVTSKGLAGVPRAVLVVIAATLDTFHIPAAGLALILGVDHFMDMGRSATNVIGNAVAAGAVARMEGATVQTEAVLNPT
ncbi:MAG: dicarboxylate/amino acid:cation symporter [Caulobacteraceae bacterium]